MIRLATALLLSCALVLVLALALALAGGPTPSVAHAAAPGDAPCAMAAPDGGTGHMPTPCEMPTHGCLACGAVPAIMDRPAVAVLRAGTPGPFALPSGDPLSGAAPAQDPPPPRV